MKLTKNSNDMSQEEFDKMMNPATSPEQIKAIGLREAFIDKMRTPMKIVIRDVYGKDITPNIEAALERLGQIVYIESTD